MSWYVCQAFIKSQRGDATDSAYPPENQDGGGVDPGKTNVAIIITHFFLLITCEKIVRENPSIDSQNYISSKRELMNDEKKLDVALLLADAAEGCFTLIDSLKLIADSLDYTANILRGITPSENNN